jgi:hypothetical protein
MPAGRIIRIGTDPVGPTGKVTSSICALGLPTGTACACVKQRRYHRSLASMEDTSEAEYDDPSPRKTLVRSGLAAGGGSFERTSLPRVSQCRANIDGQRPTVDTDW